MQALIMNSLCLLLTTPKKLCTHGNWETGPNVLVAVEVVFNTGKRCVMQTVNVRIINYMSVVTSMDFILI